MNRVPREDKAPIGGQAKETASGRLLASGRKKMGKAVDRSGFLWDESAVLGAPPNVERFNGGVSHE